MNIKLKDLKSLSHCKDLSEDYLSELYKERIFIYKMNFYNRKRIEHLTINHRTNDQFSNVLELASIVLTDDWKKNLYLKELISLYRKVNLSNIFHNYNFWRLINVSNTPNYKTIPSTNLDDLYSINSLSEEEIGFLTILLLKSFSINSKNKDEVLSRVKKHIEYFKDKDLSDSDNSLSYINIQYSINGVEQHDMRKLLHYCYWSGDTSVVDKDYELTSKLLSIFLKNKNGELTEEEKNIVIKDWKVDSSIFAKKYQQFMTNKITNLELNLSEAFSLPISVKKYRDYLSGKTAEEYLCLLNHVSKNSSASVAINISDKLLAEREQNSDDDLEKIILQEANDLYVLVFDKFKNKKENYFVWNRLHSAIFMGISYLNNNTSYDKNKFVHQCYQVIKSIVEGEQCSFSGGNEFIEFFELIFSTKNWIRDSASAYFVLDKLYSTLGVEETGRILYDVVTSDVVLTPLQWDKFLEKHEEFKGMPAVWWAVAIK